MVPPFDIFCLDSKGQLLWKGSAETLAQARLQVKQLMVSKPSDYVIFSQNTGNRTTVRFADIQETQQTS
jgi:hypothetical protein